MAERFRILIVDDEPDVADVLNRAATHTFPEADFSYVNSYRKAVAYLDNLNGMGPKLVLLDIDLQSSLNGFDFLSKLRQHPKGRAIPVVVLSSHSSKEKCDEAFLLGANAFTSKPFSYADWKSYVAQLRTYWFETVTIPKLYFHKDDE
ncbi:response regulator [Spirosoma migulaei]